MSRTIAIGSALLLAFVSGCASCQRTECRTGTDVDTLAAFLTGSFSSQAQSERDPDNYFDIRLEAVEIWPGQEDGPWLYVEQAAARALDRPYRQRVYRLSSESGGVLRSRVYTFDEPLRFAGAWAEPARFDTELRPTDLTERDGCAITVTWDPSTRAFVGATSGDGCASSLGGASYATSEVELFADRLLTWDRGFDAGGEQAWGATEGPYEFLRVD